MKIKFSKLLNEAIVPTKAHATDAGFDLTATSRTFDEHGALVYGTGIAVEIPEGYVGLVFPRSSVARYDIALSNCVGVIDAGYRGEIMAKFKPALVYVDNALTPTKGIGTHANDHIGTVQTDPETQSVTFSGADGVFGDYPDEPRMLKQITEEISQCTLNPRIYEIGERIAQLIIIPIPDVEFIEVDTLSESERGVGGYGSTGR
ncbi:MAG: hypothetical protein NC401_10440 [Ruminococcus sp.]|nr:hypothetical protein [Ruminococcus sp.]